MIQQKEFDRVSVPTFVHIQSATNHSWPTNVLCNAEQISGTPLSALNTELRDPNTYVAPEAILSTISAGGVDPRASPHWALGLACALVLGSWLPVQGLRWGCLVDVALVWQQGGWSMCGVNA